MGIALESTSARGLSSARPGVNPNNAALLTAHCSNCIETTAAEASSQTRRISEDASMLAGATHRRSGWLCARVHRQADTQRREPMTRSSGGPTPPRVRLTPTATTSACRASLCWPPPQLHSPARAATTTTTATRATTEARATQLRRAQRQPTTTRSTRRADVASCETNTDRDHAVRRASSCRAAATAALARASCDYDDDGDSSDDRSASDAAAPSAAPADDDAQRAAGRRWLV